MMTPTKAYTSIRGSLALTAAELTPTVYSTGAPYAFHGKLTEVGQPIHQQSPGGGGQRRIAGAAADARPISERSRRPFR